MIAISLTSREQKLVTRYNKTAFSTVCAISEITCYVETFKHKVSCNSRIMNAYLAVKVFVLFLASVSELEVRCSIITKL